MTFVGWCVLCICVMVICAAVKAFQDEKLMKDNPEAWKAKKQIEADEKDRKRRRMGETAVTGIEIARKLFGK